jgi:hypothetical protein
MTGVPAGETAGDYAGMAGDVDKSGRKILQESQIPLICNGYFFDRAEMGVDSIHASCLH